MPSKKSAVCALFLVTGLFCQRGAAQMDDRMSDREVAQDLTVSGVSIETELASIWFENGVLGADDMKAFSELVNRGIIDIATYLGGSRNANRKIRYFISSQVQISHSTYRSIFLPMSKVQNHSAPYLHETAHVLAPCDDCPMWFSEGLACYIQSYVSEHAGGYDGGIFAHHGNRGIDQDARRWLASSRGQAVLPFIGIQEEPPEINYDRSNVAAPFYVMAQSFLKFMTEQSTPEKLRAVFEARDFDAGLQLSTGKTSAEWKEKWLAELGTATRR